MVTCTKCGTGWTSAGLPLCPVCGEKVSPSEPEPISLVVPAVGKNGSTVLDVPPEVRMKENPVEVESPRLRIVDPSAANPQTMDKELPTAARPLNGPLLLGILAYVAVAMLPVTMAFESHRVVGILGFTLAGFFAPFAPIAWLVGLSAEKRRRDQGFRPESRITLGRLLGQGGTLLLVAEATGGLVAIAALRLSGKFPASFWNAPF